jgi:pyruvate,water dikinase
MVDLAAVSLPEVIYGDDFAPAPPADPDHTLGGLATSRGIHTGVARVVRSVSEAPRVAAGDVLVIPHSDVAWTAMFATAGAVVAEAGGMLSHSSIVAREFGIPCVVSVDGAMRIPEGSTVRVDGYTGDVRWT